MPDPENRHPAAATGADRTDSQNELSQRFRQRVKMRTADRMRQLAYRTGFNAD